MVHIEDLLATKGSCLTMIKRLRTKYGKMIIDITHNRTNHYHFLKTRPSLNYVIHIAKISQSAYRFYNNYHSLEFILLE